MKYRTFGKSGWRVSEIGFGAWAIGGSWGDQAEEDSVAALHRALDLGVNFIDTAAGYGDGNSERIIGKVLKSRSEEIRVATKIPLTGAGPWPPSPYCRWQDRYSETYIREAVENCLRNLQTERIDLLQLHTWTRAWNRDPKPLQILQKLKEEGKIDLIGVSTPEEDQNALIDLMRNGLIDSVQVIYNLFEQEPAAEFLPVARENGIGVIVRVAFEEGVLTGKYRADHVFPEDDFRSAYFAGDRMARTIARVDKIKETVKEWELNLPQVALKFVLNHPAVSTVITGIRNIRHAELNTAVSDLPDLTQDQMKALYPHAWIKSRWHGGK